MIVDDEPIIRQGLRTNVDWERLGFFLVGEAEDAAGALSILGNESIDVLLTDIKMPGMSGIELARRVMESQSGVHVVLLSAHREFELARQAMKHGIRHYLLKPTDIGALEELFLGLRGALDDARGTRGDRSTPDSERLIEKAKDYIHNNVRGDSLTLSRVASSVYMNPTYFSTLFKKVAGVSFIDYVIGEKINLAKELLRNPNLRVHDIIAALGYSDPRYFYQLFKKRTNQTPREYRMRLAEEGADDANA